MKVRWHNIACLALALFGLWLLIRMRNEIAEFLQLMGDIGPGNTGDEQMWGLIAFGLVAVTLLGVIKILTKNR